MAIAEIVVQVRIDKAVHELYDISQDLDSLVSLCPAWQNMEADEIRDRIINKLLDWVDADEENQNS